MVDRTYHFQLKPRLYLMMGPDSYHPIKLGPLRIETVMTLLRDWTPESIYRHNADFAEVTRDMLSECLHEWNAGFAEEPEEQHFSMDSWEWLGFAVEASLKGLNVWLSYVGKEKVLDVYLSQTHMESKIQIAANEAQKILAKALGLQEEN